VTTPMGARALAGAARLVTYPQAGYRADLDALVTAAAGCDLEAAGLLAEFAGHLNDRSVDDLQELFTRTFDLNPQCALEVGWHLFGEEYERGAFLVRMREALRAYAVPEAGELPDHLASMLQLVARLDAETAGLLVANALLPAVDKMLGPLEKAESPFLPLMKAIRRLLAASAPAGAEVPHA